MDNSEDRRDCKRTETFWIAYQNNINNIVGYITDLSETGLRFWSSKADIIKNVNFSLKIYYSNISFVELDIKRIWVSKGNHEQFFEAGCKLINLTEKQSQIIVQLISMSTNQFFKEIDKHIGVLQKDLEKKLLVKV